VPGTCFVPRPHTRFRHAGDPATGVWRDPALRKHYLKEALSQIPRLLGAVDRNPYRPTYGCLDRQFWHYRTAAFPSEMYQEGVLPLAIVYAMGLPGNRWHGDPRVRELAVAAIRFAAQSCHADGSCDDYYPFERAMGAAVFSLQAAAAAYQILRLDDPELVAWFERRAQWLMRHDESGRLANHQALAALALFRVAQITAEPAYREAAKHRLQKVLAWQSDEGWFDEYGGADPGYQTVTIDCLAKIRSLTGDAALGEMLDEPLRRAVAFARCFLHPDGSYAGEYGSRGTYHFYPHGMELLAAENTDAADLADGFLQGLAAGKQAAFSDDRLFAHRLGNLLEAYIDWSASRPRQGATAGLSSSARRRRSDDTAGQAGSGTRAPVCYFPKARLMVRRSPSTHTVISAARGGVFKHFADGRVTTDAGLIVETSAGRVAVSQMHDLDSTVTAVSDSDLENARFTVTGPLHYVRFETAAPIKQAIFHAGMATVGRWYRALVRRLLQRRLITGRRTCPIRLRRTFEFLPNSRSASGPVLRVVDTIELTSPRIRIRRMSFGADHQAAYVAASGVYQDSVLQSWTDLQPHVDRLNTERRVTIVREFA